MSDYICDDRIDEIKLSEDIKNMTDEEFEAFSKRAKESDEFPSKYYYS